MKIINDDVLTALSRIALILEKEISDNSLSENLISVRTRTRAADSLGTVRRFMGDDWFITTFTRQLLNECQDREHKERNVKV